MTTRFDTIVIGVGGMGSAAVYQLAARGQRVLGLEQFDIPHSQGSSHGVNRIIRLAYFEHPAYVPLLWRAFELWREIELRVNQRLLVETGALGFAAMTASLVLLAAGLVRATRHNGAAGATLLAVNSAFWCVNLISYSFWSYWWQAAYIILMALVAATLSPGLLSGGLKGKRR